MNILYITASDPRDPTSGSRQRSAFLRDALATVGSVYTVVPVSDASHVFYDAASETRGVCFKTPNRVVRRLMYFFQQLTKLGRWPFRVKGFVRSRIGWPDVAFDIVVVRYLSYAAEVAAWEIAPCYVDIDDMPLQAFDLVDGKRLPLVIRPFCRLLLMAWQHYCLRRCRGAWAVMPEQAHSISRVVPCGCLPNIARRPGPDYDVDARQKMQLMTIGLMGYGPNAEGVDWFVINVWPALHAKWPVLEYVIAGDELAPSLKEKWERVPGVRVLGFVNDVDALYSESMAVLAPILSGAGTCIKVAEAGLHGRKVFATEVALRGQPSEGEGVWYERFQSADELMLKLKAWLDLSVEERRKAQHECARHVSETNSHETFCKSVRDVIEA